MAVRVGAGVDPATLVKWTEHPVEMVRDLWDVDPDPWQEEVLEAFPHSPRMAMKASKGVGKTALEAWLVWNFMLTRINPKIACVAIDGPNLRDNLWTEIALWRSKCPLLQSMYEWTAKRVFHRLYPDTWFCSARTWPKTADREQQSATLAGLHADYIMFVLDESGGMPSAIMASAEAALSSCVEGHIVQAGNPTHLSGPLYDACTKAKRLWYVVQINADPDNPKRASRVSVEWAKEQIELYGADNPWVLVNVLGQFPPASINALIGPEEIEAAMGRMYRADQLQGSSRTLGIDVARFGDDASVICRRMGLQVWPFSRYRNLNSIQGAGITARIWNEFGADACFLDATGGYGAGWEDQLRAMKRNPIPINFSAQAHNPGRFFNKRAEMYWDAVEWIKRGGALPRGPGSAELLASRTQTTYSFKGDRIILEDKAQIKDRLGFSPDEADAFVLTFAEPISATLQTQLPARNRPMQDYNPYAEPVTAGGAPGYGDYNPYA